MSNISKTKGIVLKKVNYSDSSLIVTLFTEKYGKASFITKGARSKRNKNVNKLDILNHIEIVFYNKENRDLQLITEVDMINYFSSIRENLEALKYSNAIVELLYQLILENEVQPKVYNGLVKIFKLINNDTSNSGIYFIKFFLFLLKETGYEIGLEKCSQCANPIDSDSIVNFNYEIGFVCSDCSKESVVSDQIETELFEILKCLSTKKNEIDLSVAKIKKIIDFLEKYVSYHVVEYNMLRSLKVY